MTRSEAAVLELDGTAQSELARHGDVAVEHAAVAAHARISRLDVGIHSVTSLRDLGKVATESSATDRNAAWAGVPTLVKDLGCGIAGEPLWCGNRVLKAHDHRAARDSSVVTALRDAGFAILGRTNTAEFGATITTEPEALPPCRNPWDPTLSAGGSSGGSAAAVAAGFVPVALGTDASGSTRIPASSCGTIGFKPTTGRIVQDREDHTWFGLSSIGLLARSTRDIRGTLDVLVRHPRTSAEGSHGPLPPVTQWQRESVRPLRIVVVTEDTTVLDDDNARALAGTADLLRTMGHSVSRQTPAFLTDPGFHRNFVRVVGAGLAAEIRSWEAALAEQIFPQNLDATTRPLAALGVGLSKAELAEARQWLRQFRYRAQDWWAGPVDILVTPVLTKAAIPMGWFSEPTDGPRRVRDAMKFTAQFNVTGDPAMSLPCAQTTRGTPLGLQFVAAHGNDDLLLALARDIERSVPWDERRPHIEPIEGTPRASTRRGGWG